MNTKLRMMIVIVIASFTLTSCQSVPTKPLIDKKVGNTPKVFIEPLADTDNDGVPDITDNCTNTPKRFLADEYGCSIFDESVDFITMELRVFFERNSNELQNKFLPEVGRVAEKLHSNSELVMVLSGHISELEFAQASVNLDKKMRQTKADERRLGRERAKVIKDALVERGISADKIYSFGCADDMPIAPNDTEENASMNQRIYGKTMKVNDFLYR